MTLVWAMELPDSDKIVLLALADCANDEGHCWPSIRSLITKCSKSDRTIQASIKRLVEAGHLTRREVPGKGCNYTVHPRSAVTPEAASPPKGTTPTPEAASDKPSRTINSEAEASSQRVVDAWNEMAGRNPRVASVRILDHSRKQSLRLRLKEHGEAILLEVIAKFESSPWLIGKDRDSKWRPNIDFILQPASLRKVLEGSYGDDPPVCSMSDDEQRTAQLEAARSLERIGRPDEAAEIRRRWSTGPKPIGELIGPAASKILGGAAR